MRLLCAVLTVLAAIAGSPRSAAAADWQIDMPAAWVENPALVEQQRNNGQLIRLCNVKLELKAWEGPAESSSAMIVMYCAFRMDADSFRKAIDEYDRGTVDGILKPYGGTRESNEPERVIGSLVIRDSMVVFGEARARVLRRYQPAVDGLHTLLVMCVAPDTSACDASVNSARLLVENPVGLDASGRSSAFERGYKFGRILGTMLLIGLGMAVLRWVIRKKPKAAA